ncbi:MAG: NINE protein [Oscillospiraceae bacterium]|nr:NINE protein [Oscillospiraceae bacterium]
MNIMTLKCTQCGANIDYNCDTNTGRTIDCRYCGSSLVIEKPTLNQSETMRFCRFCGKSIFADAVICVGCGRQQVNETIPVQTQLPQSSPPPAMKSNAFIHPSGVPWHLLGARKKDKWLAFWLCFFLGYLGIHRFYEGKIGTGVLWLFTFGLCGIGWLVDAIILICKPNPYFVK